MKAGMRLRDLFDALVYEEQQTIVVLDSLQAEGTASDLHAMFNEEVLSSRVQAIDAVEGCVLKVFTTLVEEESCHDKKALHSAPDGISVSAQ